MMMKTIIKHLDVVPNSSGMDCFLAGWASGTAMRAEVWNISYKIVDSKIAANAEYIGEVHGDQPMPRATFRRFTPNEWLEYEAPEPGMYWQPSLRLKGAGIRCDPTLGGSWSATRINEEAALIAAVRANHAAHDASGQLFRGEFAAALDTALAARGAEYYAALDNLRALARSEIVEVRCHSAHGEYPVYRIDGFKIPAVPAFWESEFQLELKKHAPTRTWCVIEHV